ncbi:hypothetical protein BH10BAC4_BH10BAC4_26070 [soil metagenome]
MGRNTQLLNFYLALIFWILNIEHMKLTPFFGVYFIIGLVLEIGAILLFRVVTNFFYYGGGWPIVHLFFAIVYFVGVHFIFKSEIPVLFKWGFGYWWAIGIVIWGLGALAVYGIESYRYEYESYLVPKNFQGEVVVYFNEPTGEAPAVVGDTLIFKVQSDGSVHTSHQFKKYKMVGDKLPAFYFVDESGKRTPIKNISDSTLLEHEVFVDTWTREETKKTCLIFDKKGFDAFFNTPR